MRHSAPLPWVTLANGRIFTANTLRNSVNKAIVIVNTAAPEVSRILRV